MARFSIVLPMLDNSTRFDDTLASVLRYRPDGSQIIVVHPGHYDDPYGLGKEVDFCEVSAGLGSQNSLAYFFNRGLAKARGTIVAFLRPGVSLTDAWEVPLDAAFADREVVAVSPAIVNAEQQQLITAGVATDHRFSRRLLGEQIRLDARNLTDLSPLGPTSWAGFYRKSVLIALGGCEETMPDQYFDLDLALSFQALDMQSLFCSDCQVTTDAADSIRDEAQQPHGLAAQRAIIRFTAGNVDEHAQKLNRQIVWEMVCSLGKVNKLKHAWQRRGASEFEQIDCDHRQLLEILSNQRARLLAPALHLHVAASQQQRRPIATRRAA